MSEYYVVIPGVVCEGPITNYDSAVDLAEELSFQYSDKVIIMKEMGWLGK